MTILLSCVLFWSKGTREHDAENISQLKSSFQTPNFSISNNATSVKIKVSEVNLELSQVAEGPPKSIFEVPLPAQTVSFKILGDKIVSQGDIILGDIVQQRPAREGVAKIAPIRFWPSPHIFYLIDDSVGQRNDIKSAMEILSSLTPVFFETKQF